LYFNIGLTTKIHFMKTSRRNFITRSVLATAGISAGLNSMIKGGGSEFNPGEFTKIPKARGHEDFSISIFSKHLHWLNYNEMAIVAAEMGFDGVDLTVRPQGHILPERVEEDLPKAMEAVNKVGKNIYMITTSVNDADDPTTEKILKTASSLGIRHFRLGWMYYDDTKTIEENISVVQRKMSKLAVLNEKYSISGEYQNHSGIDSAGIYFGGSIWDLFGVLKNINSRWLGSQYDIYHATVEGANAWPVGLKLISPYIRTLDIKDFQWSRKDGKWSSESVPLGEGMVDYNKYFGLLKQFKISGPLSIHYEYPLGGAEIGAKGLTMKREDVISAMRKDLTTLKKYLAEANLT
jgi:sugar phosphate isomerase/epimerase